MSNLEKSAVAMNLVKVSFTLTPKKGNAKEYSIYVQFSSVVQLCPTLWDPIDCSTPGLLVYHQLPELAQTHVRRVGDAIQLSHPLSSPSPPFWVSGLQRLAEKLFPSMVGVIRMILSARAPLFSGLSLQLVMKYIWCLLLNLQVDTSGQNCFLRLDEKI